MLSGSTVTSFSYGRNNLGYVSSQTDTGTPGAGSFSDGYNSLDEVNSSNTESYGYDAANDLTTAPNGETQSFNALDELCWQGTGSGSCGSPPTGATTYTYSSVGNLTATTPHTGSATSYSWNAAHELTGATIGSTATTYAYGGMGILQSEMTGSTTTALTWSPLGNLPALISDGTNYYLYGPGSTPIEQINISTSTPSYLITDQLGSVRAITSSTGSVTGSFTYDAYGNVTGTSGTATTPFGYAGYYHDTASGLDYLDARWYDAATGQFMSIDPSVIDTQSPFAYANDNPVNGVDPSGASWYDPSWLQRGASWLVSHVSGISCAAFGTAGGVTGFVGTPGLEQGLGIAFDFDPETLLLQLGWQIVGGIFGAALGCASGSLLDG